MYRKLLQLKVFNIAVLYMYISIERKLLPKLLRYLIDNSIYIRFDINFETDVRYFFRNFFI